MRGEFEMILGSCVGVGISKVLSICLPGLALFMLAFK